VTWLASALVAVAVNCHFGDRVLVAEEEKDSVVHVSLELVAVVDRFARMVALVIAFVLASIAYGGRYIVDTEAVVVGGAEAQDEALLACQVELVHYKLRDLAYRRIHWVRWAREILVLK
jgi:hypothetical protein